MEKCAQLRHKSINADLPSLCNQSLIFLCLNHLIYLFIQVNSPAPVKGYSLEHYKKAFARQRAKDLSEHADIILAKDKEIEELRQECRDLHAKLGPSTVKIKFVLWNAAFP